MARRSSTTKKAAASKPTTEAPTEDSVTTTETEAPEATAAAETPTEAKTEAPEFDLSAFKAAADKAVEEKDSSTGELPTAAIEPVVAAYRELSGLKAKNAAKRLLEDEMKSAMNRMDVQTARAYLLLGEGMTAGSTAARTERAPADPTEAYVQLVAGLKLAIQLATESVPEGVSEDWKDKANALVAESTEPAQTLIAWVADESEDKGDEPETSAFVKSAVKLSQGKAARVGGRRRAGGTATPYTGERRDIGKHIASAFEGVEPGTFLTVAQIRSHRSDEYGDDQPSAGAISARLFPSSGKVTVEGIEPGENEDGRKGAKKIA